MRVEASAKVPQTDNGVHAAVGNPHKTDLGEYIAAAQMMDNAVEVLGQVTEPSVALPEGVLDRLLASTSPLDALVARGTPTG